MMNEVIRQKRYRFSGCTHEFLEDACPTLYVSAVQFGKRHDFFFDPRTWTAKDGSFLGAEWYLHEEETATVSKCWKKSFRRRHRHHLSNNTDGTAIAIIEPKELEVLPWTGKTYLDKLSDLSSMSSFLAATASSLTGPPTRTVRSEESELSNSVAKILSSFNGDQTSLSAKDAKRRAFHASLLKNYFVKEDPRAVKSDIEVSGTDGFFYWTLFPSIETEGRNFIEPDSRFLYITGPRLEQFVRK